MSRGPASCPRDIWQRKLIVQGSFGPGSQRMTLGDPRVLVCRSLKSFGFSGISSVVTRGDCSMAVGVVLGGIFCLSVGSIAACNH